MGSFMNLFLVALMPVLEVIFVKAIGLFLALKRIDILGKNARHHLNTVNFYVFIPALVGSNLAKTVTFKSFLTLWFMPVNILVTFIIGSALGWLLGKITSSPKHIKGLILSSCSAGNLGAFVIIIVPALCKGKETPFGAPDVCEAYALAYASLSMALGTIYLWLYVYNIVRISSKELVVENQDDKEDPSKKMSMNLSSQAQNFPASDHSLAASQEPNAQRLVNDVGFLPSLQVSSEMPPNSSSKSVIALSFRIGQCLRTTLKKINLKAVLAPSTIGAIVGFFIGMIPPFRKLLIGNNAPLHVLEDTAIMLGNAAIPASILILGANLLKGLKGSGVQLKSVIGIIVVRYILLPLLGIVVIKGAVRAGLVPSRDPLFQFTLLLQYSLPPAMAIGTITQAFGAGQSECSVIMLWTYALAPVALTLWSTLFLWLVGHHS